MNCKNCGNNFTGNFCNNCGQKADTKRFKLKEIIDEIQASIFNLDKGLFFTTKQLLLHPGNTLRNYLNGQRVNYVRPFPYFFYLGALYIILVNLAGSYTGIGNFLKGIIDASSNRDFTGDIFLANALKWLSNNYIYSILIIIPFLSLSSYLLFRKQRLNYSEHLIINSFVIGLQLFLAALLTIIQMLFSKHTLVFEIIDNIILTLGFLIPVWCYYSLFNSYHPISRLVRILITFLVLAILLSVLLFILIGAAFVIN